MPTAMASTESVKSSREPVRATRPSIHGTVRGPMTRASAMNAATFAIVSRTFSATVTEAFGA
jgi:hypothetical protein